MAWLYFIAFTLMVAALVGLAVKRPERAMEFPYFMGITFGVFLLPQAFSLVRFPGKASAPAVSDVLLLSCLCLAACVGGYQLRPWKPLIRAMLRPVNETRLFHVGLLFVVCGFFFSYRVVNTDIETSERGGMTGIATIYLFFAGVALSGFAICLFVMLRRPGVLTVLAALASAFVPVQAIVVGRREGSVMFLLIIGMGLFFRRGIRPPRWLLAVAIVFATLAIPATGTYRSLQNEKDWAGLRRLDLWGDFREFLSGQSTLELRNAAILIEHTRENADYQYGAGYWNHLVFRFVPAQFLSAEFKQSLMISGEDPIGNVVRAFDEKGHEASVGSTVTGIGDSFQQFGWFGWLFFAGMAVLFRTLWHAAHVRGAVFAQLLYISIMTSAMRAVTHWTLDFIPGLLYNVIFLGGALLYVSPSKVKPGRISTTRKLPRSQSRTADGAGRHVRKTTGTATPGN